MSIPARPSSQDPQSQLLWNISKQLEQLLGIMGQIAVNTATTTTTTTAAPTTTSTTTAAPTTTTTTTI